jgi:preprotein translocase subunit SecE
LFDKKPLIGYTSDKESPQGFLKNLKNSTLMNKAIQFFIEAKAEMLKVNWPSKKQTINYTLLVIAVSLVVAGFLGGLDSIFGYILRTYIIK